MPVTAYPSGLPCPQTLRAVSAERRLPSEQPAQQFRAISRERLATETISWTLTAAQAALFADWFETDLELGGSWFTATWPTPQGQLYTCWHRFIGFPQWSFIPGGCWTVSARCEVQRCTIVSAETSNYIRWLDPIGAYDGAALLANPQTVNPVLFGDGVLYAGVVGYTSGTVEWNLAWAQTSAGQEPVIAWFEGGNVGVLFTPPGSEGALGTATLTATVDGVIANGTLTATVF